MKYVNIKIISSKGSYLENKKLPKEGDIVYFLFTKKDSLDQKIAKGKIERVNNIDNKGLSNTYLDINSGGRNFHVNIDQVFDHKPKYTELEDQFGKFKKWV